MGPAAVNTINFASQLRSSKRTSRRSRGTDSDSTERNARSQSPHERTSAWRERTYSPVRDAKADTSWIYPGARVLVLTRRKWKKGTIVEMLPKSTKHIAKVS